MTAVQVAESVATGGVMAVGEPTRLQPDWSLLSSFGLDRDIRFWFVPPDQPWCSLTVCIRKGCTVFMERVGLCMSCKKAWIGAGRPDRARWSSTSVRTKPIRQLPTARPCRVCHTPGHERPVHSSAGLCAAHDVRRRKLGFATVEEFLETYPAPLPTFGRCRATWSSTQGCSRWAWSRQGLCYHHTAVWSRAGKPDLDRWLTRHHPFRRVTVKNEIDLSLLSPVQFEQVCWGLQQMIAQGHRMQVGDMSRTVTWLAAETDGESLDALVAAPPTDTNHRVLRGCIRMVTFARADPAAELRRRDIRLAVLNPDYTSARVDLNDVSQGWLLDLGQRQVGHLLAVGCAMTTFSTLGRAVRWWSKYLRESLQDGGADPTVLSRDVAVSGFVRWLRKRLLDSNEWRALPPDGTEQRRRRLEQRLLPAAPGGMNNSKQTLIITEQNIAGFCAELRRLLTDQWPAIQAIGGEITTWQFQGRDVPSQQRAREASRRPESKALPKVVFDQLRVNVGDLGEDGLARNSVEFLLHSGRRPEDMVNLPFDCLQTRTHTIDGIHSEYYNLHYLDRLKDGKGGHMVDLPLFTDAALPLLRQQQWLRRTRPELFTRDGRPVHRGLRLFPSDKKNPEGVTPISANGPQQWISAWMGRRGSISGVVEIGALLDENGEPFDRTRVFPYALRFTFGQNLHDAGVPIDVIQQLMGHDDISSTQIYASPSSDTMVRAMHVLTTVRAARLSQDGSVVMLPIPQRLRDHEAITRASMPAGACSEKGNVHQHGSGCQFHHQCENCFFWRVQVSDLPDLRRRRRRTAIALARQEARMTPDGALNDALAWSNRLVVKRLDDVIAKLVDELEMAPDITNEQRSEITVMLDRWEQIDRELLEPLGEKRGLVAADVDERTFHPLAAREADTGATHVRGGK